MHPRRYYLLKAQGLDARGDPELAQIMRARKNAISGTELAADFPSRAELVAAHYTAVEDVDGATSSELLGLGLSPRDATAIPDALAAL